jgi:hypothetical protein
MKPPLRIFTLIHVQRGEQSVHNASVNSFEEQVRLYVSCAGRLRDSLRHYGLDLTVLTNDRESIDRVNDEFEIPVTRIPCDLPVPSGIHFYSAHFKIDAFRYLATLDDPYVALIDADMRCINPIPAGLQAAIARGVPVYFDVTAQVSPAHGAASIVADKRRLMGGWSAGLWAGGEFISGPPAFFRRVYDECLHVAQPYFADYQAFHHQSDETLASAALERLMIGREIPLLEAGALSVVARYWSIPTLHVQPSLAAYAGHMLLHLPADKGVLARSSAADGASFMTAYRTYLRNNALRRPFVLVARKLRHSVRRLMTY